MLNSRYRRDIICTLTQCVFLPGTDPVLSSVAIVQLQDIALDRVARGRNHPPSQGGAVVPGAALLQLQEWSGRHRGSDLHCGEEQIGET